VRDVTRDAEGFVGCSACGHTGLELEDVPLLKQEPEVELAVGRALRTVRKCLLDGWTEQQPESRCVARVDDGCDTRRLSDRYAGGDTKVTAQSRIASDDRRRLPVEA